MNVGVCIFPTGLYLQAVPTGHMNGAPLNTGLVVKKRCHAMLFLSVVHGLGRGIKFSRQCLQVVFTGCENSSCEPA